jgi:hypothetical protein
VWNWGKGDAVHWPMAMRYILAAGILPYDRHMTADDERPEI